MARKSRANTFTEGPWSHEWSRNAEAKRRQVEGLNQNDAIIGLLTEQNSLLRYIADTLYAMRQERGRDAAG